MNTIGIVIIGVVLGLFFLDLNSTLAESAAKLRMHVHAHLHAHLHSQTHARDEYSELSITRKDFFITPFFMSVLFCFVLNIIIIIDL